MSTTTFPSSMVSRVGSRDRLRTIAHLRDDADAMDPETFARSGLVVNDLGTKCVVANWLDGYHGWVYHHEYVWIMLFTAPDPGIFQDLVAIRGHDQNDEVIHEWCLPESERDAMDGEVDATPFIHRARWELGEAFLYRQSARVQLEGPASVNVTRVFEVSLSMLEDLPLGPDGSADDFELCLCSQELLRICAKEPMEQLYKTSLCPKHYNTQYPGYMFPMFMKEWREWVDEHSEAVTEHDDIDMS